MAESREAGWSALGHSFLQYDRKVFIEALCDWGWCGDGAPPAWYRTQIPKTSSRRKASIRLAIFGCCSAQLYGCECKTPPRERR